MTISSSTRTSGPFVGNGVTKIFPFSFKVFDRADLLVATTVISTGAETILTLDSGYKVTLNKDQDENPGGIITTTLPVPTGSMLAATSAIPTTQPLELTNEGGFYPKVISNALDRATIQIQQLAAKVGTGLNVGAQAAIATLIALTTSAGASMIGFLQAGAGAVQRTLQAKARESVSVMDYGAVGDWDGSTGTDDSAAFQRAIDAVALAGGGEVRVPPVAKAYRLAAMIHVKSGVRLVGAVGRPALNFYTTTLAEYYGGYVLAIDWGAGTSAGMAIRMAPKTTISGLTFIYPGQVTSLLAPAPIVFPPTISGVQYDAPGGIIENLNFVNAYKAIYFPMGHGELAIRHITGQILNDFLTLNGVINADQITDVNASGIFYLRSSPDFNFTNNTGLLSYIQKNGKAFVLGYADAIRFAECFVGNCYAGLYFGNAPTVGSIPTQYAYGDWHGGGMEGVTFPVFVNGSSTSGINSNGFRFVGTGFAPVGLYGADRTVTCQLFQPNATFSDEAGERGKIVFTACTFWGSGNWQPNCGPLSGHFQSTGGDIECHACTFKIWQSYVASASAGACSFKFVGCTFPDYRTTSGAMYHFQSAAGSSMRLHLGGGNDFHGFFATNFAPGTVDVYETSQPYTFPTPILPSVDPLPIPAIGRHFIVNGSGSFSYADGPYKDRIITLEFLGSPTVIDGGNLQLSGSFFATPDDTLTLIGDGTKWREMCRSAN